MQMHASTAWPSNRRAPSSTIRALLTVADLEHSETEERWFSIGGAANGALLSVVYLWSDGDPATFKIRLISARNATHAEIRQYREGL
jgi:uncharacterized DUF497 family protein